MKLRTIIPAALLAVIFLPSAARADVYLTPFVGTTFGGDASQKFSWGTSLSFVNDTPIGFDLDFGLTPDFFGGNSNFGLTGDNNVTSLTADVTIGAPMGYNHSIRPYAVVGVGLLRTFVDSPNVFDNVTKNDWGYNVGGGLVGFFSDHVGLKGDVRYYRRIKSDADNGFLGLGNGQLDFWRGTIGLALRFNVIR